MTTTADITTPVVRAELHFPLISRKLSVDIQDALAGLTGPQLHEIALHAGEVQDDAVAHRLLKALGDESALEAYADYRDEYRRLDRQLRSYRGYGLDGDEQPKVVLNPKQMVAWLAASRPNLLNSIVLDYFGPDIQLQMVGKRWSWSTRAVPSYCLPAQLGGRAADKNFPSLRQVEADVTAQLNLVPVFEEQLVTPA